MVRTASGDVFHAIGEAHRRRILESLVAGEKHVGALVEELALPQPQVSKCLRVLTDVGLVHGRSVGRRRFYRLEPQTLQPLGEWVARFEGLWSGRLDRLDQYLIDLQRPSPDSPHET